MKKLLRRIKFNSAYLFGNTPWDTGITPPELYDFMAAHSPGRAIDIGCGTGTNIITMANAGWQVTGFDFASRAVRMAERKIKKAGLHIPVFVDDATKMDNVQGQFDLALDIGCFHSIENKAGYLTQLTRILAPGGFWLMYGFFKTSPQHGPGLLASDVELILAHNLTLASRKDGFDRRERPSAWFLWQAGNELTGNK